MLRKQSCQDCTGFAQLLFCSKLYVWSIWLLLHGMQECCTSRILPDRLLIAASLS